MLTIRPLLSGDTATVQVLFARLGDVSRARRFGAKPRLSPAELDALALADGRHHALVAFVEGDPLPAGIAWLVRDAVEPTAEVACAVADELQGRGIGSALMGRLAADARAAGIHRLHATIAGDNRPALSLVRGCSNTVDVRFPGGQRDVVLALT